MISYIVVPAAKGLILLFVGAIVFGVIVRFTTKPPDTQSEDKLLSWADENGVGDMLHFRSDMSGRKTYHGIPRDRDKLRALAELYLYGNSDQRERLVELKNLPHEIEVLKNLVVLDTSVNKIDEIPETIGKLKHLTILNLHENRVAALPNSLFRLKNLKELQLSRNRLTALPPEIKNLKNLQTLCLEENRLESLPKEITALKKLAYLDIRGNEHLQLNEAQIEWAKGIKEFYCDKFEVKL
ncbi:MAG: leucine-rich repeat domain-containing protein [Campylobacteraceae bacterium]|jgi:hypothetical protein|nr:leucine-rich repeat domain-containing protein [Campylobacteraceae bacterium]